jgi:hypothetical protein
MAGKVRKSERFHFRLTPREREAMEAQAESRGLSASQYLRMIINETETKEAPNRPKKMPWER